MAEKLSITIFLAGAEEIERQLAGIGASGVKAFDDIADAAAKAGGFDKLDPKDISAKLQKFGVTGKDAIDKITGAVAAAGRLERIVGGVQQVEQGFAKIGVAATAMSQRVTTSLNAVGTAAASAVGAIAPLRRTLALFGIGGVSFASVSALAVGMETAADSARVLEGNLQALFRNQQQGTAFFNTIQNAARTAGADLNQTGQTMVGIVTEIRRALQAKGIRFAPGEGFKEATKDAAVLFDTLQKGMQLSGTRAEDTNKAIKDLFTEISKNQAARGDTFAEISQKAQRMGAVLRELAARFPQLANELVKFLGTPGQTMEQLADQVERGIRKIDIPKFNNALKQITPTVQGLSDAFDPTLAQRMDAISGAWNRLLDSFGKSPASAGIRAAMDDIAKGLDEIARKQEQVGKFTVDKPPATVTGAFLDEVLKTIETTKREWNALVRLFSQPIVVADEALTKLELLVIKIGDTIRDKLFPKKITVPFEADPEPVWVEAYLGFIEKVKSAFKAMFTPDVAAAGAPEPAWVQSYLGFIAKVKAAFLEMFTKRPEVGGTLGGGAVPFADLADRLPRELQDIGGARIEDRRGQIDTTLVNTAFGEVAAAAEQAADSLQGLQGLDFSGLSAGIESLDAAISSLAFNISSVDFSGMAEALSGAAAAAQQLGTDLQNLGLSAVAGAMQAVASAANSAAQALSNVQGSGGFAHGGLLGGRGTGTSDSNLAWVSRGEHIMPARTVRQPGVLAFLEALRRSGGSLRDVLDDMGRFALGGMVPRTIPAFASGGLAGGGMSNVTIQFPGMPEISGLRAPEKVVDELRKAAALAQVRSGGRKPSRYS